jgi:transposase
MQRIGEDVSEQLDVVPAEFFVHRHIYGKWACRCCQRLVPDGHFNFPHLRPVNFLQAGRAAL